MALKIHNDDTKHIVDGLLVPVSFDVDLFRSGLQYKARSDDIFIVTHPASGTHWMLTIVYGLLTGGRPCDEDMGDYLARTPFLERVGKDAVETKMVRPGAIKTHYPFGRVPYHPQAKYISVIRQPKDVCTSFYRFLTGNSVLGLTNTDFNTFFKLFINGQIGHIDYFEHLRLTWSHKDLDNVLLVSFEQMKQDPRNVIRQVAKFLDVDLTEKDKLLDFVEKYSSFDYMKKNFDSSRGTVRSKMTPSL